MNHVGLICCKNESDILPLAMTWWCRDRYTRMVAQDGSTDGCRAMLHLAARNIPIIPDEDAVTRSERFTDGHRAAGLDYILRAFGHDTWVTLLHPDEFFDADPVDVAGRAHAAGATYVLWGEYRYFMHTSDRETLNLLLPPMQRLSWCAGPWFEVRQFYLGAHNVFWPGKNHSVLPESTTPPRRYRIIPAYRHYPYRSPEQLQKRQMERDQRMVQPDHAEVYAQPFRDSLPAPANSPLASWQNVMRIPFDQPLPDPMQYWPKHADAMIRHEVVG